MRFRFKEKYPRGRRGSPAKGVVREKRSQGSNPCFSAKQNGQANSLVRFCFTSLNNRDFARCGASYRLRREPRLVNLPASEEKKKASGFRLTKNGAQQGARRLDKKNYL